MEEILAVRKEIESLGDDSASKEFLLNRINELEENTKISIQEKFLKNRKNYRRR